MIQSCYFPGRKGPDDLPFNSDEKLLGPHPVFHSEAKVALKSAAFSLASQV